MVKLFRVLISEHFRYFPFSGPFSSKMDNKSMNSLPVAATVESPEKSGPSLRRVAGSLLGKISAMNHFNSSQSSMAQPTALQKRLSDPLQKLDDESMTESWVELAPPSRGSLSSSIDALQCFDPAFVNISKGNISRQSPKSLQSPSVEFETESNLHRHKMAKEMLPPGKQTDWLWDWASRPEALPPKETRYRFYSRSALTTPPNSPAPEVRHGYFSLRRSQIVKSKLFCVEVIFGLVVSNLVTFLLGTCIGYVLCKRIYHEIETPKML